MSKSRKILKPFVLGGCLIAALPMQHALATKYAPADSVKLTPQVSTWYLQTVATLADGTRDDRSGVIGRIPGGQAGKDVHDIPVFASVNGAKVAVVSVRGAEWGEDAGEFLSDYREPAKRGGDWVVTVTTKDPGAEVTLSWAGLYEIMENESGGFDTALRPTSKTLRKMRLIDLGTGEKVARGMTKKGKLPTYTFSMGGSTERQFRWVNGPLKNKHFEVESLASLESVSPMPLNFQAQRASTTETTAENQASVFAQPPALGNLAGQGVESGVLAIPSESAVLSAPVDRGDLMFQPLDPEETPEK